MDPCGAARALLENHLEEFALRPVTSLVSSVQNNGPSLLDPDPDPADAGLAPTPAQPSRRRR